MDMELSEQQRILRKMARDLLAKECPTRLVREMAEDEKGYPPELWHKMTELGWLGLSFPEKYGGLGGSFLDLVVLLEEMGRVCLPGPFFPTVVLGGFTILDYGTEEQRQEFLPPLCKGEMLFTLAFVEPAAVYKVSAWNTIGQSIEDNHVIQGIKILVPDAHIANYILCAAKASETQGDEFRLYLIDSRLPGLGLTPLRTIVGDKQFEVTFNGVNVSPERVLGKSVQIGIESLLFKPAVAECAQMVGGATQLLEMTVDWAKQRVQFRQPIGSFQAIQHACADMALDVDTSRLVTYQAAWKLSLGLHCSREIAIAKAWTSEAFRRVSAKAQQIYAGAGFMEDSDPPLYFKRAKAWELSFGDGNFYRNLIAQQLKL